MPAPARSASADDDVADVDRPRRTPHALVAIVLGAVGLALWCCALVCGATGADGHLVATCSLGTALGGAAFGVLALEAVTLDPERWRGRGLARAATTVSAAAVGLNLAAFTGPFTA